MVIREEYGIEESELKNYRKCIVCKKLVLRANAVLKEEHPYCEYCHKHNKPIVELKPQVFLKT